MPVNKTTCPDCGSDNTARCEMVYMQGTSTGTSVTAGGGLAGHGVAGGVAGSSSRASSVLAQAVAPPEKEPDTMGKGPQVGFWISLPVAIFILWLGFEEIPELMDVMMWSALGIMVAGVVVGAMATVGTNDKAAREQRWAVRMAAWRRRWVCLRCGQVFEVGAPRGRATSESAPCPHCQARIPLSVLHEGLNACPFCSKEFEVEAA